RRRHTRSKRDWSSDVCSSDLQKKRRGSFSSSILNRSLHSRSIPIHPCHSNHLHPAFRSHYLFLVLFLVPFLALFHFLSRYSSLCLRNFCLAYLGLLLFSFRFLCFALSFCFFPLFSRFFPLSVVPYFALFFRLAFLGLLLFFFLFLCFALYFFFFPLFSRSFPLSVVLFFALFLSVVFLVTVVRYSFSLAFLFYRYYDCCPIDDYYFVHPKFRYSSVRKEEKNYPPVLYRVMFY